VPTDSHLALAGGPQDCGTEQAPLGSVGGRCAEEISAMSEYLAHRVYLE